MENSHDETAAAPSGTMVREHWNNWTRFTSMTKIGIVIVTCIVVFALYFVA